jgi:hypothetical protein
MVDNSENTAWNDLHNNSRCPINDTGVDGAPVALGGFNPNWANGSINQALNSTWTINNGVVEAEDQENFDGLIMDLKQCGSYVFQDMLYGYLGDSVGQSPGDMMSYRAYPTPVISTETWSRADVASLVGYLPDGTKLVTAGQFIIMNYEASISRYLPFDIVWEVKVNTTQGDPSPIAYEVKIASGASVITHTRFVGDTEWLPATAGKVWTSSDSSSFTGDVTMSSVPSNFAQAPYYGTLETNDEVITQVEYEDVPAATHVELTSSYQSPKIYIDCTVNSCSEYLETDIKFTSSSQVPIYKAIADAIQVGMTLYADNTGTNPMPAGTYADASFVYYDNASQSNIYRVTNIYIIGAAGELTTYHASITSSFGCFAQGSGCSG